jgi:hypothetical protein
MERPRSGVAAEIGRSLSFTKDVGTPTTIAVLIAIYSILRKEISTASVP